MNMILVSLTVFLVYYLFVSSKSVITYVISVCFANSITSSPCAIAYLEATRPTKSLSQANDKGLCCAASQASIAFLRGVPQR